MLGDRAALDRASVTDPVLRESCRLCGRLLVAFEGRGHWAGSLLLPAGKRPHSWALYALCRWADQLTDSGDPPADPAGPVRALVPRCPAERTDGYGCQSDGGDRGRGRRRGRPGRLRHGLLPRPGGAERAAPGKGDVPPRQDLR
ncbi:squalene/phytoene synthase family protein [Streptomyces sp. TRM 70351]|uniref:squalene/phytoene synthase family protein n=1 Tax=Streptomyces sp. TRM 70351 TaxID=3116552 RepID=UPI003FCC2EDE